MPTIGQFDIATRIDFSGFRRDLAQIQPMAQQGVRAVQVRAEIDQGSVRQAVQRAAQAVEQVRPTVRVRAEVNETIQDINRVTALAKGIGNNPLTLTVRMQGGPETEQGMRRVITALREAQEGQAITVQIRSNGIADARNGLLQLRDAMNAASAAGARVTAVLDPRGFRQAAPQLQGPGLSAADRRAEAEFQRLQRDQARTSSSQASLSARSTPIGNISAEANKANQDVTALLAKLQAIGNANVRLTIRADGSREAIQAVERTEAALRGAKQNENIVVNVKADNAEKALQTIERLEPAIKQAQAAGARVEINPNVSGTGQTTGLVRAALGGAGRGLLQSTSVGQGAIVGAGFGATAAVAAGATAAVAGLVGAIGQAIQASVQYNATLQTTTNTFEHYTGSAEAAQKAISGLRELAAASPFGNQQVLSAGAGFLRVSQGDVGRMQELTQLTVTLAAARPELGFENMQGAIQQLVSGDFRAFEDRVNIGIGTVNRLAEQGFSGMELYRKAVEAAGGSIELLTKNQNSYIARLTTFQSLVQQLNASAGKGFFEALNDSLGQANEHLRKNEQGWNAIAEAAGRAVGEAAKYPAVIPGAGIAARGVAAVAGFAAEQIQRRNEGQPSVLGQAPPTRATTELRELTKREGDAQSTINLQKKELEVVGRQLRQNALDAQRVTGEYEKQLIPLRQQLTALQRPSPSIERNALLAQEQQVRAGARAERALGDPTARANLAGQNTELDAEEEILTIKHRRAEISEQIGRAELQAAQQTAEVQFRSAERQIRELQEVARAAGEARQIRMEGLREEIRASQEARNIRIEALREEQDAAGRVRQDQRESLQERIRAAQEERSIARENLQEQIQIRQDLRQDAREAYRDIGEAAQEAYRIEREAADDSHRAFTEGIRDRIEAIQDQERAAQRAGKTEAERALESLNRSERQRDQQRRIGDAQRAVSEARTGKDRRDAQRDLSETFRDVRVDNRRQGLTDTIEKEKEQREKESEARQDRIRALEKQAQGEQRTFDEQSRQAERSFQADERARRAEERATEKTDRTAEREERRQTQALEKQDRDLRRNEEKETRDQERAQQAAERQEALALKAAEKADRDATRAEDAKIREQEKADRAAERAEEAKIRAAQQELQKGRDVQQDAQTQAERTYDAERLSRLKESAELEERRLAIRQQIAALKDVPEAAAAARDQVLADHFATIANNAKQIDDIIKGLAAINIQDTIAQLEADSSAKVANLQSQRIDLELKLAEAQVEIDKMQTIIEEVGKRRSALAKGINPEGGVGDVPFGPPEPGAGGQGNNFLSSLGNLYGQLNKQAYDAGISIAKSVSDGIAGFLNTDTNVIDAFNNSTDAQFDALDKKWIRGSPSQYMFQLGVDIAQGQIDGLASAQPNIDAAFAGMFDQAWVTAQPSIDALIDEIITRFAGGEAYSLGPRLTAAAPVVGQSLLDLFNAAWAQGGYQGVDAILAEISDRFARIGDSIDTFQNRQAIQNAMSSLFGDEALGPAFTFVNQNMEIYGHNAAVSFQNGYAGTMSTWHPQNFTGGGGGGGGAVAQSGSNAAGSGAGTRSQREGGGSSAPPPSSGNSIEDYLRAQGLTPGTFEYAQAYNALVSNTLGAPSFAGGGTASGISRINENRPEIINDRRGRQFVIPRPGESLDVIPIASREPAGAIAAGTSGNQINVTIGSGAVSITGDVASAGLSEEDMREFGRSVLDDFVDILEATRKTKPKRVDRVLPGAR